MKSKAQMMPSVTKREALTSASSSGTRASTMKSSNPRFSLKINAMKMSPGEAKKKSRPIQRKRVSFKKSAASLSKSSKNMIRARDAKGKFVAKKGTKGAEKSETIYMQIQQASNGKTAKAIVVKNEKGANKADVKDVKIVEK